ncbi:MAG TPA: LptF/LptG family permease [Cryomorphaceae bacterium]|nr:LptF/LptG family permease [Cryomorphaceae bacterium]
MKKLDLYIIKKFLGTFFFMLSVIMSIAIVFDVSEKLEKFIKSNAPFNEVILDYYVNFVFFYGNLFSSLLIFLSVLLFTSQLAQRTEIVAILASGVSFNRLLLPYFLGATVLVAGSLYFTHYQLPRANATRLEFENEYLKKQYRIKDNNLHRQYEEGSIAYFKSFSTVNNIGYKFSIENWDEDGDLRYKLMAERARYDSTTSKWKIENYYERYITEEGERIARGRSKDTLIALAPSDFGQRLNIASTMVYDELNNFIESERKKGSDKTVHYEIEKHQRTSFPFATYILTIIGVSIASRKSRGGIGAHLAIGVLVAVTYIFAMKVTTVAATNAGLNPLLAVWLPNIFYFLVAIYFYFSAQK